MPLLAHVGPSTAMYMPCCQMQHLPLMLPKCTEPVVSMSHLRTTSAIEAAGCTAVCCKCYSASARSVRKGAGITTTTSTRNPAECLVRHAEHHSQA